MLNYPEVVVGGYIFNDKNEILLISSPKWGDGKMWLVPGGHIEFGEKIKNALLREIKEELGIKVKFEKIITVDEDIFPKSLHSKKHYIYLQCKTRILPQEKIKMDGKEIAKAKWFNLQTAVNLPNIHPLTKQVLKMLLH